MQNAKRTENKQKALLVEESNRRLSVNKKKMRKYRYLMDEALL